MPNNKKRGEGRWRSHHNDGGWLIKEKDLGGDVVEEGRMSDWKVPPVRLESSSFRPTQKK